VSIEGMVIKKIIIFHSGEVELWVGTTMLEVMGLHAAVSTLAAAFFVGFSAAGIGAVLGLGLGF
jgi:hypothetical protein